MTVESESPIQSLDEDPFWSKVENYSMIVCVIIAALLYIIFRWNVHVVVLVTRVSSYYIQVVTKVIIHPSPIFLLWPACNLWNFRDMWRFRLSRDRKKRGFHEILTEAVLGLFDLGCQSFLIDLKFPICHPQQTPICWCFFFIRSQQTLEKSKVFFKNSFDIRSLTGFPFQ